MGVMEVTDEGIVLKELAPGVTIEDIQEVTEPQLIVSEHLKKMK
jgi:acyl CoA:acetate/3-ketoacid CoA transferase beta subunit